VVSVVGSTTVVISAVVRSDVDADIVDVSVTVVGGN